MGNYKKRLFSGTMIFVVILTFRTIKTKLRILFIYLPESMQSVNIHADIYTR